MLALLGAGGVRDYCGCSWSEESGLRRESETSTQTVSVADLRCIALRRAASRAVAAQRWAPWGYARQRVAGVGREGGAWARTEHDLWRRVAARAPGPLPPRVPAEAGADRDDRDDGDEQARDEVAEVHLEGVLEGVGERRELQ